MYTSDIDINQKVTVIGMGITQHKEPDTFPNILQKVEILNLKETECINDYAPIALGKELCAGTEQSSHFPNANLIDSGGPFLIHKNNSWFQVGVVSRSGDNHASYSTNKYGIYEKVSESNTDMLKWIQNTTNEKVTYICLFNSSSIKNGVLIGWDIKAIHVFYLKRVNLTVQMWTLQ